MPFFSDSGQPPGLVLLPARQPTAAVTAPVDCWIATSVTMFARKQCGSEMSGQSVGRPTLVNDPPVSVERNSPAPVAAYTRLAFVGSTATLNAITPAGTPLAFRHVLPRSVLR